MHRTMNIAANTMGQLQKQLDSISNNIANLQTTGYKKEKVSFSELMYQQINTPNDEPRRTPQGIRTGVGAGIAQIQNVLTQGSLVSTGRLLDFAITKENQFFKVLVSGAEGLEVQYTRDGAFYLAPTGDNEMTLVTSEGYQVLDENNNPIVFSGNLKDLQLQDQGMLLYTNDEGDTQIYHLGVVQINKPQSMERVGGNRWTVPQSLEGNVPLDEILVNMEGIEREQISLQQSSLEQSNVNLTEEMTNLLQTQRAYQFQAKAITLVDQMQGLINGIR